MVAAWIKWALRKEWERKSVVPALRDLYDEIWIYGLPQICDPLEGVSLPISVRQKMIYTGYLHREVPNHGAPPRMPEELRTGWIVKPGDSIELARAISSVLALDAPAYRALAGRARQFADYMFSPRRIAAATLDVYSSLLEAEG